MSANSAQIERARKVHQTPVTEKPVTVTVPMSVLTLGSAQPGIVHGAQDAGEISADPLSPAIPFINAIASAPAPAATALPAPRYIPVGPEYFGPDAGITPYVISRSPTVPLQKPVRVAELGAARNGWRTSVSLPSAQVTAPRPMLKSPAPSLPPSPLTDGERYAVLPPRPAPAPSRAPMEPAPRNATRLPSEPKAMVHLRGELAGTPLPDHSTRLPANESATGRPLTTEHPGLANPQLLDDQPPTARVYRLQMGQERTATHDLAGLELPVQNRITDISTAIVEPVLLADEWPPQDIPGDLPRIKLGALVREPVATVQPPQNPAANDPARLAQCMVPEGARERMILVCEGADLSKADILRSVIEGESVVRNLRPFDATASIADRFGFDKGHLAAVIEGPRSAPDLEFLRSLRAQRQQLRIKGRNFDLYVMEGAQGVATLLVEAAAPGIQGTAIPAAR